MPSLKRLLFFSSKKKGHGSKFLEHHGYDNLRQAAYHQTAPSSYHHNQQQQGPPPPHSFSHRQHLFPQLQLIMQPPHQQSHHLPPTQTQVVAQATGHCQFHQCSFQQKHQNHHQQNHHQQTNNLSSAHMQHFSPQSQVSGLTQGLVHPHPHPQQHQQPQPHLHHQSQQQHQQQPVLHHSAPAAPVTQHPMTQPSSVTTPTSNGTQYHTSANSVPQCACQTCPYNHQVQHIQPTHCNAGMSQAALSTCQNQMLSNELNSQQQCHNYNNIMQPSAPACPPYSQQHQHQQPQPQQTFQCHEHIAPNRLQSQQYQYHTIQPNQYQHQKQLQQQQNHQHQRIQSLHQQMLQNIQQFAHNHQQFPNQPTAQTHSQQLQQQQQQQVESRSHDFSRYANMQSLINDSRQSTRKASLTNQKKCQESFYCNQGPELRLPPYEPAPDYDTFMERRNMYSAEMSRGQISSKSSQEPIVSPKTKDSSYENLRSKFSPYSNIGICRQELGYTS